MTGLVLVVDDSLTVRMDLLEILDSVGSRARGRSLGYVQARRSSDDDDAQLAAASGAHARAFAEFETLMRPFVEANQALGLRSAKLMRSGEMRSGVGWLLKQLMRMIPGRMTEWIINRSTQRITQAANAISLKDYSSFLRSKETTVR